MLFSVIEKGSTNSSEIVYNRLSKQDIDNFYNAKIGDIILLDTAKNLMAKPV